MTHSKNRFITHKLVCLAIVSLLGKPASSQILAQEQPEQKWLKVAKEQYLNGHYRMAVNSANNYLQLANDNTNAKPHFKKDEASFYKYSASLKLDELNSVDSIEQYITRTSNPTYKQRAAHALAQFYFKNGELRKAIDYYELAGIANLTNKEVADSKFELAYCYFNLGDFEKAEMLFSAIKEIEGKYYDAGNYYYGLLAYNSGRHDNALQSFMRIVDNDEYKSVVPYYVAEIQYFKGNKQKALKDALKLISKKDKIYYHNELHLLVAQIYFEQEQFTEALPYFEYYYNNTDRIRKEDLYEMAYCYYKTGNWEYAIDNLQQLSNTRDSLGQTSMYLLGDCYLKVDDKKSARNAFGYCADMPFNQLQKEASLLLAAKLSYELGFNAEAIYYVNILLADFPRSQYQDEAKTLLSDLLLKTSNYAEAYDVLQGVKNADAAYKKTYQKVAYGYAMQQMQQGNLSKADELLSETIKYQSDATYTAAAQFWRSEVSFKQKQYKQALTYAQAFLDNKSGKRWVKYLSPAATDENAYFNMGYASMELQQFDVAQKYFKNAQQQAGAADPKFVNNAILREADAYFMQKSYDSSILLYNKVIDANSADADYARFQKAKIYGIQGKNKAKIATLNYLVDNSENFAADARYEMAVTYIEEDKYSLAIKTLTPLTTAYDTRSMAPKALMKIGFAYQQIKNATKAIEAYKEVALQYPTAPERPAALDALKSLYIQTNQPDVYVQLLKDNNLSAPDQSASDSTYYAAAEAQFSAGDWNAAKQALSQYIDQYPNGIFLAKAQYYMAESHRLLQEYNEALPYYDQVLASTWSEFAENSAREASKIAFDNKDYTKAISYYTMLRNSAMSAENLQYAYNGLMQSNFNQQNYEAAAAYADTLSAMPNIDQATKSVVLLYKAKSLKEYKKYGQAMSAYQQIAADKNINIAAEAQYSIAELHYLQGNYKKAEEAASDAIQKSSGSDYWVVKSYLLISDVLIAQKDYFNAKATLKSIIKNTKIAELKQEAEAKLQQVQDLEKQNSKLSEE